MARVAIPDVHSGWFELSGNFPPSVNTEDVATDLELFESPACYGADYASEGVLKTGSIPSGTTRTATTKSPTDGPEIWVTGTAYKQYQVVSISNKIYAARSDHTAGAFATDLIAGKWGLLSFYWFYNRMWAMDQKALFYATPQYDDIVYFQDIGLIIADANIITFMPALGSAMWVATGSGSYLVGGATSKRGNFTFGKFAQEMSVTVANRAMTLGGVPVVSNSEGVWRWAGGVPEELTRPVRHSLGSFGAVEIKADYKEQLIIGTAKFVIDTQARPVKLFDYGTTGFLFTSRAISQGPSENPFMITGVAIVFQKSNSGTGNIQWESKVNAEDWYKEKKVRITAKDVTRKEFAFNNSRKEGRRFQVKFTSMTSNIQVKSIEVALEGFSQEASMGEG